MAAPLMQQSTSLALYDALLILLDVTAAVANPAAVVCLFPDIASVSLIPRPSLTGFVAGQGSRASLHHCLQLYFLDP